MPSHQGETQKWDFATDLRARVLAGDKLAIQCAYLLGLWNDGLEDDACTEVYSNDGGELCGACYYCQTRAAAAVEQEYWDAVKARQEKAA